MGTIGLFSLYLSFIFAVIALIFNIFFTKKLFFTENIQNIDVLTEKYFNLSKKITLIPISLIIISTLSLIYSFIANDFSIKYIAQYSDSKTPVLYKLASLWGGQQGSLLFWCFTLAVFMLMYLFTFKEKKLFIPSNIFLLLYFVFFVYLVIIHSNPFEPFDSQNEIPFDGIGLNPQLLTFSMLIHPPLLYFGYIGFAVPMSVGFAFLLLKDYEIKWTGFIRNFTVLSFMFLTMGNILGAQWAYTELGWGGYWAWDAVENASFMPWITSVVFLHSINIFEKKGIFKFWVISSLIVTFFLTIFGTFITRSGIIESVHAFAKSTIGWYFLGFLFVFLLYAIYLIITRFSYFKSNEKIESLTSKESGYLFGNILFMVSIVVIMFGTLAPTLFKHFGKTISIEPSFFNEVFTPIAVGILFLMGLVPLLTWKSTPLITIKKIILIPFVISLISGIIFYVFNKDDFNLYLFYNFLIIIFAVFNIISFLIEFYGGITLYGKKIFKENARKYGGYIIHLGVVLIFIGATGGNFKVERSGVIKKGESVSIKNYKLTFKELKYDNSDVLADKIFATLDIHKNNSFLTSIYPHKSYYNNMTQGMTSEVEIISNLYEDLYVVLDGIDNENEKIFLKIYINPLMIWIWIGFLVMTIGTILILFHKRIGQTY